MKVLQLTDQMIKDAKELIATGEAHPAGYHILVRSIEVDTGMSAGLKELAPHLASVDFQESSQEEADRQTRGTYFGIVCGLGDIAYASEHTGGEPWIELGDVSISERYAGVSVEMPPGSKRFYQFMNDENILGVIKPKQLTED